MFTQGGMIIDLSWRSPGLLCPRRGDGAQACHFITHSNSVQPMKPALATLLLLFQLQPVAGAAVCLGMAAQAAQEECSMPEHGSAPADHVTPTEPAYPQPCPVAVVCAPGSLAVPGFADQPARASSQEPAASVTLSSSPTEIYSPPPFHPPKV